MRSFQLHIPKPCSEKRENMQPTQHGAFCSSCQKEVVDFTAMSETQLKKYLLEANRGCGRFTKAQLDKVYQVQAVSTNWWRWAIAACLGISIPVVAQAQHTPTENRLEQKENTPPKRVSRKEARKAVKEPVVADSLWTIRGRVTEESTGEPLPGATIRIKGTTHGVHTNLDGHYQIDIEKGTLAPVLTYSFIGYKTAEMALQPGMAELKVAMVEDIEFLGEYMIIARKYSPRWYWWKIRSLF